jgi:hypothetical protein
VDREGLVLWQRLWWRYRIGVGFIGGCDAGRGGEGVDTINAATTRGESTSTTNISPDSTSETIDTIMEKVPLAVCADSKAGPWIAALSGACKYPYLAGMA